MQAHGTAAPSPSDVPARQGSPRDQNIPSGSSNNSDTAFTVAPIQPDGMSAGASSATTLHTSASGSTHTGSEVQAKSDLSEDIYSLAVAASIQFVRGYNGNNGVRLAHVLFAMLFTVVAQLGILVLLWLVVTNPPNAARDDGTTDLWEQAGQLQGQLCYMQHALNHSGIDISKWSANESMNCSGAWPYSRTSECPAFGFSINSMFVWDTVKPCLLHTVFSGYYRNLHKRPEYCSRILEDLPDALAAFGRGLLYPRTDSMGLESPNVTKLLVNGTWVLSGVSCDASSEKDCHLPFGSNAYCIGSEDSAEDRMSPSVIYKPADTNQQAGVTANVLVNILAFMALAVFAHDEVRRATTLCRTAASVAGILPDFYNSPSHKGKCLSVGRSVPWYLALVMLVAPGVQLIVALTVLLSGSLMSLVQEYQVSGIQVIVNSVALGFVLEIDNKIGQMVSAQHASMLDCTSTIGSLTWTERTHDNTSRFRVFIGHAYISFIGLLLVIEPLLLTPHFAATLIVASLSRAKDMSTAISALRELAIGSSWGSFIVEKSGLWYCSLMILCAIPALSQSTYVFCWNKIQDAANLKAWSASASGWHMAPRDFGLAASYSVILAVFVVLLYYKPLPSAADRWPQTLLVLQALTVVCMGLLSMGFWAVFSFVYLAFPLVIGTWVCMFLVWPLCHRWNPPSPFQTMPCKCTECCITCTGAATAACGAFCGSVYRACHAGTS